RDLPDDFQEYVQKVIKLDNRLRERRMTRNTKKKIAQPAMNHQRPPRSFPHHNTYTAPPPPIHNHNQESSEAQPMEVDTIKRKYTPLSREEKDSRHRLNLCAYCGESRHTV
ncbi:hypothetical protein BCR42DRAFT_332515, partial [Absidia repens]